MHDISTMCFDEFLAHMKLDNPTSSDEDIQNWAQIWWAALRGQDKNTSRVFYTRPPGKTSTKFRCEGVYQIVT